MELKGKITIVAGFPGIGKNEACTYLCAIPGFRTSNISLGRFIMDAKDTNDTDNDTDMDTIYKSYVHNILATYQMCMASQLTDSDADETAYVIFVDGNDRVRELLSEMQMKFIYVAPDLESFNTLVAAAKARQIDEPRLKWNEDVVKYLESPEAMKSLKRTASGDIPYIGQEETYTIPFGTYTPDLRFVCLGTLIEDMYHPSEEFKAKNKISRVQSIRLGHVFRRYLMNTLPDLDVHHDSYSRICPNTDGSPMNCENKKFTYQIGFDHYGRVIKIMTPKNPVAMALKTTYATRAKTSYAISNQNKITFLDDIRLRSKCGYFGLDSIMLEKDTAQVIKDLLEKYPTDDLTEEAKKAISDLNVAMSGIIPQYVEMIRDGSAEATFDTWSAKTKDKIDTKKTDKHKKGYKK